MAPAFAVNKAAPVQSCSTCKRKSLLFIITLWDLMEGGDTSEKDCFRLLLVFISIKYFQSCAFVQFVSSINYAFRGRADYPAPLQRNSSKKAGFECRL